MKFLKDFSMEYRLHIKIRCYIIKQENFSIEQIQLIFLGEILTPNEVNGNVAIDCQSQNLTPQMSPFIFNNLRRFSFLLLRVLLIAYCPSFANCPSGRKKAVYLQTHFAFPLRMRTQRHLVMTLVVCITSNFQAPALSNLQPLASI